MKDMGYLKHLELMSESENRDTIISMMRNASVCVERCVEYDRAYIASKILVQGKVVWFLDGHPLVTIYKYTAKHQKVQYKLAHGIGDDGERTSAFDQFVIDIALALEFAILPVLCDTTCDYLNTIEVVDSKNAMGIFK